MNHIGKTLLMVIRHLIILEAELKVSVSFATSAIMPNGAKLKPLMKISD